MVRALLLACMLSSPLLAQVEWRRFAPVTDFDPGLRFAVAYEPMSGSGYFVGTVLGNTSTAELWRHVDGGWYPVTTATSVPMLVSPVAASWSGLGMLLFDAGQCWLFDGLDWAAMPAAGAPPRLDAMAFDEARSLMIGWRKSPAQVWEFDGVNWQLHVAATQTPTGVGRLAWHETRQRVVLQAINAAAHACFSWDGTDWTNHYWQMGRPYGFSYAATPGGGDIFMGWFGLARCVAFADHQ